MKRTSLTAVLLACSLIASNIFLIQSPLFAPVAEAHSVHSIFTKADSGYTMSVGESDYVHKWVYKGRFGHPLNAITPVPSCSSDGETDGSGRSCKGSWYSFEASPNQGSDISVSLIALDWPNGSRPARVAATCTLTGPSIQPIAIINNIRTGTGNVQLEETGNFKATTSGQYTVSCNLNFNNSGSTSFSKNINVTVSPGIDKSYQSNAITIKAVDGLTNQPINASASFRFDGVLGGSTVLSLTNATSSPSFLVNNKTGYPEVNLISFSAPGYSDVEVIPTFSNITSTSSASTETYDSRVRSQLPAVVVQDASGDDLNAGPGFLLKFYKRQAGITVYSNQAGITFNLCRGTSCETYTTGSTPRFFVFPEGASNDYTLQALDGEFDVSVTDSITGKQSGLAKSRTITVNPGGNESFAIQGVKDRTSCVDIIAEAENGTTIPTALDCRNENTSIDSVTVPLNTKALIKWNSRGVSSCEGSWKDPSDKNVGTSGTYEVPASNQPGNRTFSITCTQSL